MKISLLSELGLHLQNWKEKTVESVCCMIGNENENIIRSFVETCIKINKDLSYVCRILEGFKQRRQPLSLKESKYNLISDAQAKTKRNINRQDWKHTSFMFLVRHSQFDVTIN